MEPSLSLVCLFPVIGYNGRLLSYVPSGSACQLVLCNHPQLVSLLPMSEGMQHHIGLIDVVPQTVLAPANPPLSPRFRVCEFLDGMFCAPIVRVLRQDCC